MDPVGKPNNDPTSLSHVLLHIRKASNRHLLDSPTGGFPHDLESGHTGSGQTLNQNWVPWGERQDMGCPFCWCGFWQRQPAGGSRWGPFDGSGAHLLPDHSRESSLAAPCWGVLWSCSSELSLPFPSSAIQMSLEAIYTLHMPLSFKVARADSVFKGIDKS